MRAGSRTAMARQLSVASHGTGEPGAARDRVALRCKTGTLASAWVSEGQRRRLAWLGVRGDAHHRGGAAVRSPAAREHHRRGRALALSEWLPRNRSGESEM